MYCSLQIILVYAHIAANPDLSTKQCFSYQAHIFDQLTTNLPYLVFKWIILSSTSVLNKLYN